MLTHYRYPELRARDDSVCPYVLPVSEVPGLGCRSTKKAARPVMSSNLLDNPKLFRHVVEDLPVGIYIVDRDRRIRFWNPGAQPLLRHLAPYGGVPFLAHAVQPLHPRSNPLHGPLLPVP